MNVQLVSYTPNPELLIAGSARLCYRDQSAIDILEDITPIDIEKLLGIIISSGHHSVLEHVNFTFAIDGVSRVLTHQLVRHRVGIAYSQQSQRYTPVNGAGYVTPKSIVDHGMAEHYDALIKACLGFYEAAQAKGVPNEDARYALIQAIETRLVMTVNMRQLIHMYAINACFRSQWEFRNLMNLLRREVRTVSPRLAKEMRIKCFTMGYCDEAKMCRQLEGKMPRKGPTSVPEPDDL